MSRPISLIFAASLVFTAVPSVAQELSDEEILERFKAQKEIYQSATNNGLGAPRSLLTRGLTIVAIDDPAAAGETAGTTVESIGTDSSTVGGSGSLDPNRPLVAARFEPELSVDIRIEFEFDSAAIARSQQPALDQICRVMKQATDVDLFRIVGHTDASGSDEYNQRLSILRAEEVGRHLVDNCGIAATRLETVGYGERFLMDPGAPDAPQNRRVEFQALS